MRSARMKRPLAHPGIFLPGGSPPSRPAGSADPQTIRRALERARVMLPVESLRRSRSSTLAGRLVLIWRERRGFRYA